MSALQLYPFLRYIWPYPLKNEIKEALHAGCSYRSSLFRLPDKPRGVICFCSPELIGSYYRRDRPIEKIVTTIFSCKTWFIKTVNFRRSGLESSL